MSMSTVQASTIAVATEHMPYVRVPVLEFSMEGTQNVWGISVLSLHGYHTFLVTIVVKRSVFNGSNMCTFLYVLFLVT